MKLEVDTRFGRRFQNFKKKFSSWSRTGNRYRKYISASLRIFETRLEKLLVVDLVSLQILSTGKDGEENH